MTHLLTPRDQAQRDVRAGWKLRGGTKVFLIILDAPITGVFY
jgi:hypothetical protein